MGDHVNANGSGRRGGRKRPPNEDDLTDEERSKKLKNREAAKRCRLRKIEESKNLKQQNEDLEHQNKELTKKKMELEDKICRCIEVIRQHQQHGCQLPREVQEILNSDSERFFFSNEGSDFHPVATIHRNQNMSSRLPENAIHSIHTVEDDEEMSISDSRIPTGLFSGTEIQIDQSKVRMSKSPSPVTLTAQKKDMVTVSDTHMKIHSPHGVPLKYINPIRSQNGYSHVENGEGPDQSSSPVQRVPNIDHIPWSSPSPKPNGADESGDDEYSFGPRAGGFKETPQTVNVPSSFDKLCGGGYVLHNTEDSVSMVQMGINHKTDNNIRFQMIKNGDSTPKPVLTSFKQNKPSVTQSLQATTELISQAIHDIDPSEISQSFHAQIVECAKPDSAIPVISKSDKDYLIPDSSSSSENQEDFPQEAHEQFRYGYESKPQEVEVLQQDNVEISNIPVSFGAYTVYENVNMANPNIVQSSSLSSTITEIPGIPVHQNYIISDKPVEHPGQPQVVTVPFIWYNAASSGQFQQPSQPVEEIVESSQIPTTVFNMDEENEISGSEKNASESMASSHEDQHTLESTENVNVTSSTDNYSANVSELPSLSFNDLQNTPKEIFDKKPSRLRAK